MKNALTLSAIIIIALSCSRVPSTNATANTTETAIVPSTAQQSLDYQDATQFTSSEFLYALYHNKDSDFAKMKNTPNLETKYFSDKCLHRLQDNNPYEGGGYAVWDLFGGSNTCVWGSFKDLSYAREGWYCLWFAYEEEGYIEDAPNLFLKVKMVNNRWIIDDYLLK